MSRNNGMDLSLTGTSFGGKAAPSGSRTYSPSSTLGMDHRNANFKTTEPKKEVKKVPLKGLPSKEFDKRSKTSPRGTSLSLDLSSNKNSHSTTPQSRPSSRPQSSFGSTRKQSAPSPARLPVKQSFDLDSNSSPEASDEDDSVVLPVRNIVKPSAAPTPKVIVTPSAPKVTPAPSAAPSTSSSSQRTTSATFKNLYEQCKKSGKKYIDAEFPPKQSSLYPSGDIPDWPKITEWKRVSDFCTNPQLFVAGVEAGDVIQGALGDCWFLGAMSVVAAHPELLLRCIPQEGVNEFGIYEFNFYKNGEWKSVIIDDFIPLADGKPVFSSCLDPNEVWVLLMEKAYAKLHKNYKNLEGGSELYALVDLTGGAPETIELDGKDAQEEIKSGRLWEKMVKYHSLGYLMGCADVVTNGRFEEDSGDGILQNHAYGILDLVEIQGNKLIRVRNPWGQGEWKGKWADEAKEWTPQILQTLKHSFKDDGTFFIVFEDFVQQYNRLYFLRLFDHEWKNCVARSEWKGESAGGCGNFPTWKNNPQFGFELKESTEIFATLIQNDSRMEGVLEGQIHIGFMLLKSKDLTQKIPGLNGNDVVGQTVFNASREVSKKFKLEPGKYVISPTTFHAKQETNFWIRVYVNSPNQLELCEVGVKKPFASIQVASEAVRSSPPVRKDNSLQKNADKLNDRDARSSSSTPMRTSNNNNDRNIATPPVSRRPTTPSKDTLQNLSEQELSRMQRDINDILKLRSPKSERKQPEARASASRMTVPPFFKRLKSSKLISDVCRRVSSGVGVLASSEYTLEIPQDFDRANNAGSKSTTASALRENDMNAQNAQRVGHIRDEAFAYYKNASICDQNNQFEESIGYYSRFLSVVKEAGDSTAEALAYNKLGTCSVYLGRIKNALDFHGKHDSIAKDVGSRMIANINLGICFILREDVYNATLQFRQALGYATQRSDIAAQSLISDYLAFCSITQKDFSSARLYLEKRLKITEAMQDYSELALIHQQLGQLLILWKAEFEQEAKSHFKNAVEANPSASVAELSYKQLGELAHLEGDAESEQYYAKKARSLQNADGPDVRSMDIRASVQERDRRMKELRHANKLPSNNSPRTPHDRIFNPRVAEFRGSNPDFDDDVVLEDHEEFDDPPTRRSTSSRRSVVSSRRSAADESPRYGDQRSYQIEPQNEDDEEEEQDRQTYWRTQEVQPVIEDLPVDRSLTTSCSLDADFWDDRFEKRRQAKKEAAENSEQ